MDIDIATIVGNIDRRLSDLDAESRRLRDARASLLHGPPAPAAPRRPRDVAAEPRYDVVPVAKLTAQLARTQGMRTRELAREFNGDPALVLTLLKEREAAGDLRRSGSRAGTRWYLITDEDRIRTRAAELEARSRRGRARRD